MTPTNSLLTRHQGSDGTINFWDKDARTRLKSMSILLDSIMPADLDSC